MADTLFGPTPAELEALLRADKQAFLDRAATVSPAYSAGAGVGNLLGGVVSSIFGLENPELKKARVMQEIQKKIRTENPGLTDKGAYYDIAASYLDEAGLSEDAFKAQNLANEYRVAQEDRALNTEYKQAQIGNLESEAQARLLPKAYKAASSIGQLKQDRANFLAQGDTESVADIDKAIAAEQAGKAVTPQNKIDGLILEGLIKQTGGDEIKAANLFEENKFNKELRKAAAGAGNGLDKALTVLFETNKAKEKETAVKNLDTKSYKDDLAARLSETYTGLEGNEEANVLNMTTDHINAKKYALKRGYNEDEAEDYANKRIEAGIQEVKGAYYGTNKVYKKAPMPKIDIAPTSSETPAKDKARSELPAGARAGQKVMSGPNAGKYEVLDKNGKLLGYADQGTK
jgi:hypothetical protein